MWLQSKPLNGRVRHKQARVRLLDHEGSTHSHDQETQQDGPRMAGFMGILFWAELEIDALLY